MYLLKKLLPLLVLLCCGHIVNAQSPAAYPDYDTAAPQLANVQRLIDATLPDIEALLRKGSKFAPFATVLLANDSIAEVTVSDPGKTYTPDDLKEELSIDALKGRYKAVAVFYPDTQVDPETDKAVTVVAVFAEHTDDDFAYLFFYPYKRDRQGLSFGDSFGDYAPQVMFRP